MGFNGSFRVFSPFCQNSVLLLSSYCQSDQSVSACWLKQHCARLITSMWSCTEHNASWGLTPIRQQYDETNKYEHKWIKNYCAYTTTISWLFLEKECVHLYVRMSRVCVCVCIWVCLWKKEKGSVCVSVMNVHVRAVNTYEVSPGQGWAWQLWVSRPSPSQSRPPSWGTGALQWRMRVMSPSPHVTEQEDQGDHRLQPPSCFTANKHHTH